jgi:hypothetical protein
MRVGILQGKGHYHDVDVGCADVDQVESRDVIFSAKNEIIDVGAVCAQVKDCFSVHRHFSRFNPAITAMTPDDSYNYKDGGFSLNYQIRLCRAPGYRLEGCPSQVFVLDGL